jgi:hypothetical protein
MPLSLPVRQWDLDLKNTDTTLHLTSADALVPIPIPTQLRCDDHFGGSHTMMTENFESSQKSVFGRARALQAHKGMVYQRRDRDSAGFTHRFEGSLL